jgi:hypothetical protein
LAQARCAFGAIQKITTAKMPLSEAFVVIGCGMPATQSSTFARSAVLSAAILTGVVALPARASTVYVDPVNYTVDAGIYTGISICDSADPCQGSGPSSASVSAVLLPSDYPENPNGDPYSGSAAATLSGSPAPSLLVSAAGSAVQLEADGLDYDAIDFHAGGNITYYFELTTTDGDSYTGDVPVLMNGSTGLTSMGKPDTEDFTSTSTSMTVSTYDNSTMLYTLPSGNNGGFSQSLNILPNVEYMVYMSAAAAVEITASLDTNPMLSASAMIDPTFTISPDYANDFQLTFSPSIGNSGSSVPEPSSGVILAVGLVGLGAAIRLRCKRAASDSAGA